MNRCVVFQKNKPEMDKTMKMEPTIRKGLAIFPNRSGVKDSSLPSAANRFTMREASSYDRKKTQSKKIPAIRNSTSRIFANTSDDRLDIIRISRIALWSYRESGISEKGAVIHLGKYG